MVLSISIISNLKRAACSPSIILLFSISGIIVIILEGEACVEATSLSSPYNLARAGPRGGRTFFFDRYVSVGANRVPHRDMIVPYGIDRIAGVGQR